MNSMGKPEMLWGNAPDAPELHDDESPEAKLQREENERAKDRLNAASFTEELEKTPSERMHEKLDAESFTQALEIAQAATLNDIDPLIRELNKKASDLDTYRKGMDDDSELASELDKDLARLTSLLEAATNRRRDLLKTMPVSDDEIESI